MEGEKYDERQRTRSLKSCLLKRRLQAFVNAKAAISRWAVPPNTRVFRVFHRIPFGKRNKQLSILMPEYLKY